MYNDNTLSEFSGSVSNYVAIGRVYGFVEEIVAWLCKFGEVNALIIFYLKRDSSRTVTFAKAA